MKRSRIVASMKSMRADVIFLQETHFCSQAVPKLYKIQSRWYRTPALLHKFKHTIPDACWRCQEDCSTLIHIWWSCPLIQTLWKEVHQLTSRITSYEIAFTPVQFLLHHSSTRQNSFHQSLMMHLINAAKQCVPIHWKSQNVPSIKEWFHRINRISDMEELIHIARDTPHKFGIKWACWKTLPDNRIHSIEHPGQPNTKHNLLYLCCLN